ncbi:MAG: alpha-L-glutamate ligase [Chloroflexota bacterium]
MNLNIESLLNACQKLQVDYRVLHSGQNVVEVQTPAGPRFFVNWSTPLNDQGVVKLCEDKDYTSTLLEGVINMPCTRAFLDPHVNPAYKRYRSHTTFSQVIQEIEAEFAYPFILKRNRGSHGTNVFRIETSGELEQKLALIFDKKHKDYDYVVLAQEVIDIDAEFRSIFLAGAHQFSYRKDTTGATFSGNLSPFRWGDTKAQLITDEELNQQICGFMAPALATLPIPFVGADIARDQDGTFWLIELNAAPGFGFFIRDCGRELVDILYEKMLYQLGIPKSFRE